MRLLEELLQQMLLLKMIFYFVKMAGEFLATWQHTEVPADMLAGNFNAGIGAVKFMQGQQVATDY